MCKVLLWLSTLHCLKKYHEHQSHSLTECIAHMRQLKQSDRERPWRCDIGMFFDAQ